MAKKAATVKKPARKPRRKKVEARSRGLAPADVAQPQDDGKALAEQIKGDGGEALAVYRDPLGGHSVVFASLPVEKVEATPYQRDLSEPHVKRLMNAMERVDRFLDPLIAVRHEGTYWTPNGNHRLNAAKNLGAKSVMALVMPEQNVAFKILALNTEKAHNLKERALEVIRMYRDIVAKGPAGAKEADFIAEFEEPSFITIGAAYEKRPRYSAGAYSSIVKRLDRFLDEDLKESLQIREERADKLLAFDDKVVAAVDALKAKGFQSPYIKNFVVGRINFLRFKKGDDFDFDEIIDELTAKAAKFNTENVKKEDIARAGGGPAEAEE